MYYLCSIRKRDNKPIKIYNMDIFLVQINVSAKSLEKVQNYLGLKKIEYSLEDVDEVYDYASLTLYDVSLQELNVISKL